MKKKSIHLLAALAAIGIYFVILFRQGIYPFGDNTLLVWDMDFQFSSFYTWFSEVLRGNTSFLYSLEGGLGESMTGLFAYYLSSPLNLLLVFFDVNTIPFAVFMLMTLKVGLSAAFMSVYLNHKNYNSFSIIFSCFYALSSYVLCFQYNLMWMDCYALLPLIILGIEKLVEEGKASLYMVSLAFAIFSNYYIAFMICVFAAIYYLAHYCTEGRSYGTDNVTGVKAHAKFLASSILGAAVSSVILLPSIYILRISSSSRVIGIKDIFDFNLLFNPFTFFKYAYSGAFDSGQGIKGQYPIIYCGAVCVLLGIMFFVSDKIAKRQKLKYGILLLVLFCGMIFSGPNIAWHGMAKPSGCAERFSFLWVFLAVSMAYKVVPVIKETSDLSRIIALILEIISLVIIALISGFRLSYVLNLIFSVAIVVLAIRYQRLGKDRVKALLVIMALIICLAELVYNSSKLYNEQFEELYLSKNEYERDVSLAKEFKSQFDLEDGDAYRTVALESMGGSFNKGFKYSFNSLNMYDSTEDTRAWKVYEALGLGTIEWESASEYDQFANRIASDVLGVKYVIAKEGGFAGLQETSTIDETSLYRNDDALALIFPVNEKVFDVDKEENIYARLNLILNAIGDETLLEAYTITGEDKNSLSELKDWQKDKENRIYKLSDGTCSDGTVVATENEEVISNKLSGIKNSIKKIENKRSGIYAVVNADNTGYMCASILYDDGWSVYVDGQKVQTKSAIGGMTVFPIEQGEHEVVFKFRPKGLLWGSIISVVSLLIMLSVIANESKNKSKKE